MAHRADAQPGEIQIDAYVDIGKRAHRRDGEGVDVTMALGVLEPVFNVSSVEDEVRELSEIQPSRNSRPDYKSWG